MNTLDDMEDQEDMLPEYANDENKRLNQEIKKIKREIALIDT